MIGLRPRSVRSRLTLWHVVTLAGVLSVYLAGVSLLLFWQMGNVLEGLGKEDVETIKGLLYFTPGGRVDLHEDYHRHSTWKQVEERMVEVLAPDGTVLYQNERLGSRTIDAAPLAEEGATGYSERWTRLSDRSRVIAVSRTYDLQGRPILIRVAYGEGLIWSRLRQTMAILLLALPLALAAAALAGYKMAGRALDPIGNMARR